MVRKLRVIGKRITKLKARKLEGSFITSRKIKPFKTFIKKKGKQFIVLVQNKK